MYWTSASKQILELLEFQEKREKKGAQHLYFKVIAENLPILGRDLNIQVQEANGALPGLVSGSSFDPWPKGLWVQFLGKGMYLG